MFKITKHFMFEAAHVLDSSYSEECQRIHGHSYKVEVTVVSAFLNADGMVVDFKLLSEYANAVFGNWDHSLIISQNKQDEWEEDGIFIPLLSHSELIILPFNPTAENMAKYIFEELQEYFPTDVRVSKVCVWETAKAKACYS